MGAFPSFRYGPNGQAEIFDSEDAVPDGWSDHPSKVAAPAKDAKAPSKAAGSGKR